MVCLGAGNITQWAYALPGELTALDDGGRDDARALHDLPRHPADLKAAMPELRGRLLANQSLAELTWFRVGGPAQVLFTPEDEADLAYFLAHLPDEIPVTVVGVGSNLIVRDGGVPGVVIRLGRGFGEVDDRAGRARPRRRRGARPARSRAPRRRPASPGSNSCSAFRARSAARCA